MLIVNWEVHKKFQAKECETITGMQGGWWRDVNWKVYKDFLKFLRVSDTCLFCLFGCKFSK